MNAEPRMINWLESTSRLIRARFPEIELCSDDITDRMAALLLERLPSEISSEILALLPPPEQGRCHALWRETASNDRSIGYPTFIEHARLALSCAHLEPTVTDGLAQPLADTFLWAVTKEIPAEIKTRIRDILPLELRSRMDLYQASSEEAKVA